MLSIAQECTAIVKLMTRYSGLMRVLLVVITYSSLAGQEVSERWGWTSLFVLEGRMGYGAFNMLIFVTCFVIEEEAGNGLPRLQGV